QSWGVASKLNSVAKQTAKPLETLLNDDGTLNPLRGFGGRLDPCDPVWSVVSSPNVSTDTNILDGVAVVSATDVWAVGNYRNGPAQTLVEHWNGTSWSVVSSPNVGTGDNYLSRVG